MNEQALVYAVSKFIEQVNDSPNLHMPSDVWDAFNLMEVELDAAEAQRANNTDNLAPAASSDFRCSTNTEE